MLKRIETPSKDVRAFEVCGNLTKEDYTETLIPMILKARSAGDKLKFLISFGKEFEGLTLAGAWEDFKLGIHHMSTFERIAIVSDKEWITQPASVFGSMLPCCVNIYKNDELSSALAWIDSGDIGLKHTLDEEKGVLVVDISAPLSSDNFFLMNHIVDGWIEKEGELKGMVIHVKEFPGWKNLGSLISHIQFVKNHHRKVRKIAFCSDSNLLELLPQMASHFVEAELKHFSYDQLEESECWASGKSFKSSDEK